MGHGTKIASQIFGTEYGLAKKVNVVFVKITMDPGRMWASVLDAFTKITNHLENNVIGKAVINMSWSLPTMAPNMLEVSRLQDALEDFTYSNVVLVTSAGNDGKVSIWTRNFFIHRSNANISKNLGAGNQRVSRQAAAPISQQPDCRWSS